MGETPRPSDSSSSLAGVLARIGELLRDHPVLLFAFGMAVVLLGAGALALENLRLVLIGVIALTVLGMVAWIFTQLRLARQPEQPEVAAESGAIQVDSNAKVIRSSGTTGSVESTSGGSHKSGGIHIGSGAEVADSTFQTGGVGKDSPAGSEAKKPFRNQ